MSSVTTLNLKAWKSFFAEATYQASQAIGLWTNGDVQMSLGDIRESSLGDVAGTLNLADEVSTLVRIGVDGEFSGQLILTFDDANSRGLIDSLLDPRVVTSCDWSPLELSAFAETGNIIGSVYLNCMTELTGHRLWPMPPQVVRDYAMSVIEQAVMFQAQDDDRVLICNTQFSRRGREVEWNLVFIPSPELLHLIEASFN